jgi:hypothetical protein
VILVVEVQLHLLLHPAVHKVVQGGLVGFRVHWALSVNRQRRRRRSRYLKVHPYTVLWNGRKTLSLARSPALAVFLCGAAATLSHSLALVFLLLGRVESSVRRRRQRRNCNTALRRARGRPTFAAGLGSPSAAFIYITQPKTHRVPPMLPYLGLLFSLQSRSLQGHATTAAAFFAHTPSSSFCCVRSFMHRARFFGFAFWPSTCLDAMARSRQPIANSRICRRGLSLSLGLLARLFRLLFFSQVHAGATLTQECREFRELVDPFHATCHWFWVESNVYHSMTHI